MQTLQTEVIATITKAVPLKARNISANSTFADLGIDSLDAVNIAIELESTFDIEILDQLSLTSIGDVKGVVRIVESLIAR